MNEDRVVQPLLHVVAMALLAACLLGTHLQRAHADAPARPAIDSDPLAHPAPATLQALRPPKRMRPLVAVLGLNEGSETVDFLVPYAVLTRSGVADVVAVSVAPGAITLMPALTVLPEATIAQFDRRNPTGADYVIVPAMHDAADPRVLGWLRAQATSGATIVGVCAGSLVLAEAGLLRDRRATTHWFQIDAMRRIEPSVSYVPNARYVVDRGVVTSTGISAALPVSLAIVAAIGGTPRADALARTLGIRDWGTRHDSAQFGLTVTRVLNYAGNALARWRHERMGIHITPGTDEIALAFVANAYAATYLVDVLALGASHAPITLSGGLRLVPDGVLGPTEVDHTLAAIDTTDPSAALARALSAIRARYGDGSAEIVRLELEYPGPGRAARR